MLRSAHTISFDILRESCLLTEFAHTPYTNVQLPLEVSKLTIALAQLQGPYPTGKHRSFQDGRETFTWRSETDVASRIEKFRAILSFVEAHHPETNILLFPEYSLPVQYILTEAQKYADRTGRVLVPGADNIRDSSTGGAVYNLAPVIIPGNSSPIFISKRELSQWEEGFVDRPPYHLNPLFVWDVNGTKLWLSIYICLDMTLALQEPPHFQSSPGLFLVPMCSPEIETFHQIGDILLRGEGGRACFLCNATDNHAIGNSSVVAITPDGKKHQPAIVLPQSSEHLLVCEIDLLNLAPPKKSTLSTRTALGLRHQYRLTNSPSGPVLTPENGPTEGQTVAVLNPALFQHAGVEMRMAFLPTADFSEVTEKAKGRDFEILAVLGEHDLLVTHLSASPYEMLYDINDVVPQKGRTSLSDGQKSAQNSLPHFRVSSFYKVLGTVVSETHRRALTRHDAATPSETEMHKLLSLAQDWNTATVTDAERESFQKAHWVLDHTKKRPGEIGAVMAIAVDFLSPGDTSRLELFEQHVLPEIVAKPEVTSVYGGSGERLPFHYVVRLSTDARSLYPLILHLHNRAHKFRILVSTTTYVVVSKLAGLNLVTACLRPNLTPGDMNYVTFHILPHLTEKERGHFRALKEEDQRRIIELHRRVDRALEHLRATLLEDAVEDWRKRAARSLLDGHPELLKDCHDRLQNRSERVLVSLIDSLASEEYISSWCEANNIKGKDRKKLTFGERIRILRKVVSDELADPGLESHLSALGETVLIRNSLQHGELADIPLTPVVAAIEAYCDFLTTASAGGGGFGRRRDTQPTTDRANE
jgi:hypothetical protein